MERSKNVAIITGVISLLLAVAYLVIVQVLDFRGEMQPAPMVEAPPIPASAAPANATTPTGLDLVDPAA
ncbi:MAG: hypothetical protein AAFU71_19875 [Cyanobacteria bacterium J06632_22]